MSLGAAVVRARTVAEAAMVDACVIYRDAAGSADDTLNETTGELTQPAGDQTTIYTGPCLLRTANIQARRDEEGGAYLGRRLQSARIPVSAPAVIFGDILEVTASAHDPRLVTRRYRVIDIEVNTYAVTRKVTLEEQAGQVVR